MEPLFSTGWDPISRLAQQNPLVARNLAMQAQQAQQAQRPQIPTLSQQEEDSMLGQIGSATLGGLGYVGSVLEKTFGGRALRGVLGGKPREALSVLPFSDWLSITDPEERVSGQQLLGLEGQEGWAPWLAGMGAEIALDPGTYLTFGSSALTGAGRVAKAVGVLPKNLAGRASTTLGSALASASPNARAAAEVAAGGAQKLAAMSGEHLGGLVGLGLPLANPSVVLGANPAGAALWQGAGKVAQRFDQALRSIPLLGTLGYGPMASGIGHGLDFLGRHSRALFDPKVMGATTHMGQEAAEKAHYAMSNLLTDFRGRAYNYLDELQALGQGGRGAELRQVLEGTFEGPIRPEVASVANRMKGDLKEFEQLANSLGVNVPHWVDPMNRQLGYFPRQMAPLARPSAGHGPLRQPLTAIDDTLQGAREPIFQGFTRGTEGINELILDPLLYEGQPLAAADYVRRKYLVEPTRDTVRAAPARNAQGHPILPGSAEEAAHYAAEIQNALREQQKQAGKLVDWVRNLDPQYRASIGTANPLAFYGNHPLADYLSYFERGSRLYGAGDAAQSLLAKAAVEAPGGVLPTGTIRLSDALEKAALTSYGGANTAAARLSERLGRPASVADLYNYGVGPEALAEIQRYTKNFQAPESANLFLRGFDKLTTLTKAMQTALWPAFHVRNLASGLWQNVQAGGLSSLGALPDAYNLMRGRTLADANKIAGLTGMSAEEATRALGREMAQHGVGGHLPHLAREVVGPAGDSVYMGSTLEDLLTRVPGRVDQNLGKALGALQTTQGAAWNPLNTAGVASNADIFAPVVAGRQVGDVVEGVNRGSLYLTLRRQGHTAQEAARRVLETHFDYTPGALTPFEKTWMRRLVPFYTFSRRNIPLQAERLATNPGGMSGLAAKVAGDLRQQGGFLPEYLGSGLAVPLSEEENGTRRYLTRLDLPPEQAFEWLKAGDTATAMGLLGQLNPLIKGPLEYATGKQFFTGRDVGDLYSMTGSSTLDQLVANSPLSRGATTLRTLTDERKWQSPLATLAIPLNLLTGARVSDVDVARQRDVAAREYVREALQHLPEFGKFESIYLRPGMENLLSPQEMALYRLQKTLQQRAQQQAQMRARGG